MNIEKANNMVIKIENEIENLLTKKELELSKVLPQAKKIQSDIVATTRTEKNKFLYYVYSIEKYDKEIDILERVKVALTKYIERELIRLNKYKRAEELIVFYRENKRDKYKWEQISKLVGLSMAQCKRIYKKYRTIRSI